MVTPSPTIRGGGRVHVPYHHLINVCPVFFLPLLRTSEREAYTTLPLVRCGYLLG